MKHLAKLSYLSLIYLFFYFPIFIIIIYSFNNASYSLLWQGFTLHWYKQLFQDVSLAIVAFHSLSIAVLSATFASIIATFTAISLYRYRFFSRDFLYKLIFILIVLPDLVMGITFLLLFSALKIPLGFWSLLLAHITFCMPFAVVTVYSRVTSLDKNIFEAARDLGADNFVLFKKILIPLLWPAILASWLLSFTLSLDDVIISFFVTGPNFQILPLQIFSMVKLGVKPELNALCSVIFTLTLLIVTLAQWTLSNKYNFVPKSKRKPAIYS